MRSNVKKLLIIAHDLTMTALAAFAALALRFEGSLFTERVHVVGAALPVFVAIVGLIYSYFHLYKGKWRFASMPDLVMIAKAVGVVCLLLVVGEFLMMQLNPGQPYFLGRRLVILYWLVQCTFLGAPRLAYRYWKDRFRMSDLRKDASFALLLGRGPEVEIVIRALESKKEAQIIPVGILSPRPGDLGQSIRNVPVEGTLDQLEAIVRQSRIAGKPIHRLLATSSALERDAEVLAARAGKLGLLLSRLERVDEAGTLIAPVGIEDLLSRPPVAINHEQLALSARGKTVLITGGGGSIGARICQCCVIHGAKHLIVIDNSEPALHAVMATLRTLGGNTELSEFLCDIRDGERLHTLFSALSPEIVFHAAALKQVPYLERDWDEGIKTNALGSIHVADAAIAAKSEIVVMISTDKAVRPVSILGATKRFAEMAMEARDEAQFRNGGRTRLVSVRFGNVLGSTGSVIPTFKAQIARGGPVTVTHPDMVRYFMTIEEAANLVLVAASHAMGERTAERVSVYVLRMGQPVRIMDLAERMIRLSGYEPHREIRIRTTGIRPGERLNEVLFAEDEARRDIGVEGVVAAQTGAVEITMMRAWIERLAAATHRLDRTGAEALLKEAIPDFDPAPPVDAILDLSATVLPSSPMPSRQARAAPSRKPAKAKAQPPAG